MYPELNTEGKAYTFLFFFKCRQGNMIQFSDLDLLFITACLFVLTGAKSITDMLNDLNIYHMYYIQCNQENYILINRFSERHDAPRTNFDNFLKAMLAVFQVCVRSISPLG